MAATYSPQTLRESSAGASAAERGPPLDSAELPAQPGRSSYCLVMRLVASLLAAAAMLFVHLVAPTPAGADERVGGADGPLVTPHAAVAKTTARVGDGALISGRVSGVGTRGVATQVHLERSVRGRLVPLTPIRVGPDGRWTFRSLAAGRYRLWFRYGTESEYWPGTPKASRARLLRLSPGERLTGRDVRLVPTVLSGRVTTTSGRAAPVDTAVLVSRLDGRWRRVAVAATDTRGSFRLRGLGAGTFRVSFRHPDGGPPTAPVRVSVAHEGRAVVEGVLPDTGRLVARVQSHDGQPIVDVATYVFHQRAGRWVDVYAGRGRLHTDSSGAVQWHLPSGRYRVGFSVPGVAGAVVFVGGSDEVDTAGDVRVRPGRTIRVDAVARRPGSVSGRVTDITGASAEAGHVMLRDGDVYASVFVGADGRYLFPAVPPRTYDLLFSGSTFLLEAHPDVQLTGAPVGAGARTPIVVEPGSALTGYDAVVARESVLSARITGPFGEPVTNATIAVQRRIDDAWVTMRFARTAGFGDFRAAPIDDEGRFTVGNLAKGEYRVAFDASLADGRAVGRSSEAGRGATMAFSVGEQTTESLLIVADPAGTISGTVTGLSREPLDIVVERASGTSWTVAAVIRRLGGRVQDGGSYSTPPLPDGRYRVTFGNDTRFPSSREVLLVAGSPVLLDEALDGYAIEAFLAGAPQGAVVDAVRRDGSVARSAAVRDGEVVVGPLAAGEYALRLRDPQGLRSDEYYDAIGNGPRDHPLTLERATWFSARDGFTEFAGRTWIVS
jgi:hypothetical protein